MIIYKIQNLLNGKKYIGQTKRNLKIRMLEHIRHKTTLSDDIKKFGLENFDVQKIDFCFNQLELDEKERYWINFYNSIEPNQDTLTSVFFIAFFTCYKALKK